MGRLDKANRLRRGGCVAPFRWVSLAVWLVLLRLENGLGELVIQKLRRLEDRCPIRQDGLGRRTSRKKCETGIAGQSDGSASDHSLLRALAQRRKRDAAVGDALKQLPASRVALVQQEAQYDGGSSYECSAYYDVRNFHFDAPPWARRYCTTEWPGCNSDG